MSDHEKNELPEEERDNGAEPEEAAAAQPESGAEAKPEAGEDWRDKYLRTLAELDNFRKRMERERRHERRFLQDGLMRALLPVLDSLDIAQSAEGDLESIRDGVALARQDALRVLGDHGLKEIEALGKPFDPNVHEAMGMIPADAAPGTIVEELCRGYLLHDRVLRAAKVYIAAEKPADAAKKQKNDGKN